MKNLLAYLDDIFYWLGAALVIISAYLVEPKVSVLVAGAFCLHFSYLLGKAKANQ